MFETWYERGGVCPQITNSEWMKVKILCDLLMPLKESIHETCTDMMTKWNKYFLTADHLNVVAHIMDPRFKLRFLADMYKDHEDRVGHSVSTNW